MLIWIFVFALVVALGVHFLSYWRLLFQIRGKRFFLNVIIDIALLFGFIYFMVAYLLNVM